MPSDVFLRHGSLSIGQVQGDATYFYLYMSANQPPQPEHRQEEGMTGVLVRSGQC